MGMLEHPESAVRSRGPAWWFLDCLMEELSAPDDSLILSEALLPEGASPPLHVHADLDDSFYVLDGTMVVRCGDDVQLATPASWVPFPAGVPHTFRVMGGPARTLQIHRDDSFLELVRAIGEPAAERRLPLPSGGPGIERLEAMLAGHGIVNVGPSMSEEEAQAFLAGIPS